MADRPPIVDISIS